MFIINKLLIGALTGAFFLANPAAIFAQVKINEFSPNTTEKDDWVELYNNSDDTVNLKTYTLIDGSAQGNTKSFDCFLAPRGFLVVDWSSKLNNEGDIIKLLNEGLTVDCVTYGNGADRRCEGQIEVNLAKINNGEFGVRIEDGIGTWQVKNTNTKDGPNNGSQKNPEAICFTPSPSPSPEANPSPSPEAQASSSPIPSPAASKMPSPTPKASPSTSPEEEVVNETPEPSAEEIQVLGATDSAKPTNPYRVAIVLIGLGLALIGGSIWGIIKHGKMAKS